jgi:hypothetical protein
MRKTISCAGAFTGETGRLSKQADGSWESTYGWTGRPDGKTVSFSDCDKGKITFGKESGRRIPFDMSNTTFQSGGVKLVGRLIMPHGNGKVPVVVLIHGSEQSSGIDTLFLQSIFPAQGCCGSSRAKWQADFARTEAGAAVAIRMANSPKKSPGLCSETSVRRPIISLSTSVVPSITTKKGAGSPS